MNPYRRIVQISVPLAFFAIIGCPNLEKPSFGKLAGILVGAFIGAEFGDAVEMMASIVGTRIGKAIAPRTAC